MRVFNLTDVPTPTLQATGLVNVTLKVAGGTSVAPGGFADVVRLLPGDQRLVSLGAIAEIEPKAYLRNKPKKKAAPAPPPKPALQVRKPDPPPALPQNPAPEDLPPPKRVTLELEDTIEIKDSVSVSATVVPEGPVSGGSTVVKDDDQFTPTDEDTREFKTSKSGSKKKKGRRKK